MSDQSELVCSRCQPTEAENARLRQALQSLQAENNDLAEELAGARATQRTLERQIAYWKGEAEKRREDDPESQTITTIYETWKRKTGHKRSKLTDERRKLIKGQLRTYKAEDLIRAIEGAALLPYVRYGKRYTRGDRDDVATQLEHCIGSKPAGRVETNIDYYRRACRAAAEQRAEMWDAYHLISAHANAWAGILLDAAVAVEKGVEVDNLEQLLWDRIAEDDARWAEILAVDEKPNLRVVA